MILIINGNPAKMVPAIAMAIMNKTNRPRGVSKNCIDFFRSFNSSGSNVVAKTRFEQNKPRATNAIKNGINIFPWLNMRIIRTDNPNATKQHLPSNFKMKPIGVFSHVGVLLS